MLTQTSTSDCLHRSILVVDIEGYSRPARTNLIRARLRDALYLLLDQAIGTLGAGADLYEPPKDEGDGALVLFHPQVPKDRLFHPLVPSLVEGLASYNAGVPERERMRLRVVVHAGELLSDPHGYFGEDLDQAFGLLSSEMLRAALASNPGPLALLVTDRIHQGVVKHGLSRIDPATYQPVDLTVKGTRVRAWLHIPATAPAEAVA